jgi:hypothetical protein
MLSEAKHLEMLGFRILRPFAVFAAQGDGFRAGREFPPLLPTLRLSLRKLLKELLDHG